MEKQVIFFDFDGTIADTFPIFVEFARSEGFDFSPAETEGLRNLSMRDVITKLKLPTWKIPFLANKFHGYFQKTSMKLPRAYARGFFLFEQRSCSPRILRPLVLDVGSDDFFVDAHCGREVSVRPEAVGSPVHLFQEYELFFHVS